MWQKMLIPVHFQHFRLIFIILIAIFGFEKIFMSARVDGGEKVYVLYTCENVDIFGWSLTVPISSSQ